MNASNPLTRPARVLALCAVLGLASISAARATDWTGGDDDSYRTRGSLAHLVADGSLVDVQVQVDGAAAPLFFRPGANDRHYFQAFRGRNYSVVVSNNTGRRVGVLIAVDGLNVVTGEKSSLGRNESMYVLDPYERAVIRGWRTSLDEVRRFVFVDEQRSYAERTGQANGDMGWIRVLSFREVERTPWWGGLGKVSRPEGERPYGDSRGRNEIENAPKAQAAPAPEAPRSMANAPEGAMRSDEKRSESLDANPGTGWGDRRQDPVRRTSFEAAWHSTDEIVLRYEYSSGLRALGIFPQTRLWDREQGQLGFAKPPRR
jgi:hypothetical protein